MPAFKATEFIDSAARHRITYSLIVPAMFNLCLLAPSFDKADLSAWRVSGYGGAIMPEATLERIAAKLPKLKLLNCYCESFRVAALAALDAMRSSFAAPVRPIALSKPNGASPSVPRSATTRQTQR